MSFAAIQVPPHRTLSKKLKKPILTDAELEQIVAMLHKHQTPSDGVVYTEPTKSGKQGPRTVAYMRGYAVRCEILAPSRRSRASRCRSRRGQTETDFAGRWP